MKISELTSGYLGQIAKLNWQPVNKSVWNSIQDEGLDEEQDAPNPADWIMGSLTITPDDAQALMAYDDNAIEEFNRFDIALKQRYPGMVDLIDYDNGTVTIVKVK
jgi:hypothetical protein